MDDYIPKNDNNQSNIDSQSIDYNNNNNNLNDDDESLIKSIDWGIINHGDNDFNINSIIQYSNEIETPINNDNNILKYTGDDKIDSLYNSNLNDLSSNLNDDGNFKFNPYPNENLKEGEILIDCSYERFKKIELKNSKLSPSNKFTAEDLNFFKNIMFNINIYNSSKYLYLKSHINNYINPDNSNLLFNPPENLKFNGSNVSIKPKTASGYDYESIDDQIHSNSNFN
ncbi:hypothetical protein WICMUC_000878 [Wickerhamomyces mucosus]|uniref:Uncharacterized protein n=1 Tax=Wickerhamomyces mucosus TaxID=1378264 RepID=A0A9P8PXU7_9ASCO|nr:hypothetical protein WICMUC_000878 [Wickerhamomyces mucosus]